MQSDEKKENNQSSDKTPKVWGNENDLSKILGLSWDSRDDTFRYQIKEKLPNAAPTKRTILAYIAAINKYICTMYYDFYDIENIFYHHIFSQYDVEYKFYIVLIRQLFLCARQQTKLLIMGTCIHSAPIDSDNIF